MLLPRLDLPLFALLGLSFHLLALPCLAGPRMEVDHVENGIIYVRPAPQPSAAPTAARSPSPSPSAAAPVASPAQTASSAPSPAPNPSPTPGPATALKTGLDELLHLGSLQPAHGPTWFVFTGKAPGRSEKSLYLVRSTDGKPTEFVYPGKLFDPKTRQLLLQSRAFYGKCLRDRGEILVFFQREYIDRRRGNQSSVFIAEPRSRSADEGQPFLPFLDEKLLERRLPRVDDTLKRVRKKECTEIDGRNRLALSKPLDVKPTKEADKEDDEDAEEPESAASSERGESREPGAPE